MQLRIVVMKTVSRFAGATVSDIAYGHRIESFDDDFFNVGENLCRIAGKGATASLLDIHPICKYGHEDAAHSHSRFSTVARLPSWAPGAWFIDFIKGGTVTCSLSH